MTRISVLQKFQPSCLRLTPYPHIIIENALPEDLYNKLAAEYPYERKILGYSGYCNNTRYQLSAADALSENRVSQLWKDFIIFHSSKDFYVEVLNAFGPCLTAKYKKIRPELNTGVRFIDKSADIWLDCQPGINSPVTKKTTVKGPHLDHPAEIYAGLLYFRDPEDNSTGGDLNIYKYKTDKFKFFGQRYIDSKYVELVGSVPYAPNNFVMFLNTIDSVHGVTDRSTTHFTRRLCNIIGEIGHDDIMFEIPIERQPFKRVIRYAARKLTEMSN